MKRILFVTLALVSICSVVSAQKSPVYAPKGLALDGYDAVAFSLRKTCEGSSAYAFQWNGAQWLFADKADLESFQRRRKNMHPNTVVIVLMVHHKVIKRPLKLTPGLLWVINYILIITRR